MLIGHPLSPSLLLLWRLECQSEMKIGTGRSLFHRADQLRVMSPFLPLRLRLVSGSIHSQLSLNVGEGFRPVTRRSDG